MAEEQGTIEIKPLHTKGQGIVRVEHDFHEHAAISLKRFIAFQAPPRTKRCAVISSLNLLFILFAFLFQVVLASVFGFCDAVERFGPKYLVAGLLGMATWTQSLYWSFFSNSNTRGAWPAATRALRGSYCAAAVAARSRTVEKIVNLDTVGED